MDRRLFLKGAAASLALGTFGASAMDAILRPQPWRVGLIGTGWYGKSDLLRLMQVAPVEVVALCDVDAHQLQEAAERIASRQVSRKIPQRYRDHQKMLAENQFDLVLIGTPDHWHALQTIDALKAGAHVYLQKPISVDVMEGEAMVAAARQYRRTVQVGLQRRSTPHLVEAKKKIIDAGLLGNIAHAEAFCYYHMRSLEKPPVVSVPDYFDYDRWTGPAPLLPFTGLPHGRWRSFMEYGNGVMGDMGVHMLDAVRWMLNLGWPKKIYSSGGIFQSNPGLSNTADTQTAVFEFEKLNCVWQQRTWGGAVDEEYPWGYKIYGDKGTLSCSVMKYDFVPVGAGQRLHGDVSYEREQYPEDLTEKNIELHTAPATRRHMLDFLYAIENKTAPAATIEDGHISTASCILANVSMKTGRALSYDPQTHTVRVDDEATRLLTRPYRGPWRHPELSSR